MKKLMQVFCLWMLIHVLAMTSFATEITSLSIRNGAQATIGTEMPLVVNTIKPDTVKNYSISWKIKYDFGANATLVNGGTSVLTKGQGMLILTATVNAGSGDFTKDFAVCSSTAAEKTHGNISNSFFGSGNGTFSVSSGYDPSNHQVSFSFGSTSSTPLYHVTGYLDGADKDSFRIASSPSSVVYGTENYFKVELMPNLSPGTYKASFCITSSAGTISEKELSVTVLGSTTTTTPSTGTTTPSTGTTTPSTGTTTPSTGTTTPSTGTTTPSTGTTTPSTGTTTPSTGTTTTPSITTGNGMASSSRDTTFRLNEDGTYDLFMLSGIKYYNQDGSLFDELKFNGYRYDANHNLIWHKEIPRELSEIIGIFLAEDYNFILVGEENWEESDKVEVLRVIKYSKEWVRQGSASLYGGNTVDIEGQHGNRSYFLADNLLFIHCGHAMYKSSDGDNHQANMTVVVDINTMTIADSRTKVSNVTTGYVSHALEQEVLVDSEGRMVTVDRGDAHPRGAYIYRSEIDPSNPLTESGTGVTLTTWPGSYTSGNVYTGSNVHGLVETKEGYITAILDKNTATTVGAKDYTDAYLYFISKTNFTSSGIKINSFSGYSFKGDEQIYGVKLIPTSTNGGLVLVLTGTQESPYTYRSYIANYDASGSTTALKQVDLTMENFYTNLVLEKNQLVFANTASISNGGGTTAFHYIDTSGTTKSIYTVAPYPSITPPLEGASSWAVPLITEAGSMGILNNMTDVTSSYQTDITRQQFCKLIINVYETAGYGAPTMKSPFTDTTSPDVISAYILGIVSGKSEDTFAPRDKITREELAVMVMRTAELFEPITGLSDIAAFSDFYRVSSWAKTAVIYAEREGFLAGSNGRIMPQDYLTCEQAIAVALRLAQRFV